MPEFFETGLGRVFYQRDVPSIAKSLDSIAKSLQTLIKVLEAANPEPPKTPPIIPQSKPHNWMDDDIKLNMGTPKAEPEWFRDIRLPIIDHGKEKGRFWKRR